MPQLSNEWMFYNVQQKDTLNFNVGQSVKDVSSEFPLECQSLKENHIHKQIWTSDLHDGTRIENPSTLSELGQTVVISGSKGDQNPYAKIVFSMSGIQVYGHLSSPLQYYTSHSSRITQKDIQANFDHYKNDDMINKVL